MFQYLHWRRALLLPAVLLLSACSALNGSSIVAEGPGSDFDPATLGAYREMQDKVLLDLAKIANAGGAQSVKETLEADGKRTIVVPDTSWDSIVKAGMEYADHRCDRYLAALFKLDRAKKTSVTQIGLVATAVAGIMAAAESAAKEVAMAAIAFGLASTSVENLAGSLLYELEPSSVSSMVRGLQDRYRQNVGTGYKDRATAMLAIRRYASLCVPSNIEAEVNLALKKTVPEVQQADPAGGNPPTVTFRTILSDVSRPDDNSALLWNFVRPGGVLDQGKLDKLKEFLRTEKVQASYVFFLEAPQFAAQREQAAKQLNLK